MNSNSNEQDKNLSYTNEEFHQYMKLMKQSNGTIASTLANFMKSDDDTVIKAEAMKDIIDTNLRSRYEDTNFK